MLGVLVVVFGRDRVTGTLCVAGQLQVFLGDVRCIAPDLQVRSVGLIHARQWILVMVMMVTTTTFTAVATPHALVLTVSHDLLFRQPPFAAALMPPFLFIRSLFSSSLFSSSLFSSLLFSPCVTPAADSPQ